MEKLKNLLSVIHNWIVGNPTSKEIKSSKRKEEIWEGVYSCYKSCKECGGFKPSTCVPCSNWYQYINQVAPSGMIAIRYIKELHTYHKTGVAPSRKIEDGCYSWEDYGKD